MHAINQNCLSIICCVVELNFFLLLLFIWILFTKPVSGRKNLHQVVHLTSYHTLLLLSLAFGYPLCGLLWPEKTRYWYACIFAAARGLLSSLSFRVRLNDVRQVDMLSCSVGCLSCIYFWHGTRMIYLLCPTTTYMYSSLCYFGDEKICVCNFRSIFVLPHW